MKHLSRVTLCFVALIAMLVGCATVDVYAVPRLPEQELAWKNLTVDGKKTAVYCMYRDSGGIMWTGTNSGLYFYDGVTVHPVAQDVWAGTQIYSIVEHDGRLYLGANHGLLVYDYQTGLVTPYEAPLPKEIRSMLLIDGNLWIGSLYGIFRLGIADGSVDDYSSGLPHKSVYSLHLLIEADAVKFESVITNLLSNACKYSDDGATISCGISTDGSSVEITVSDDGVGISDID